MQAECALRLAGAAAALREHIGAAPRSPTDQNRLEALLEPVQKSLAEATATAAWSEGCAMPVERALEQVLRSGAVSLL
jgi:hypothetical protein